MSLSSAVVPKGHIQSPLRLMHVVLGVLTYVRMGEPKFTAAGQAYVSNSFARSPIRSMSVRVLLRLNE